MTLAHHTEDNVFTIEEFAKYLKLSLTSAYKLAQRGKIPGQKLGRHWRFHHDAIDKWLKKYGAAKANP